MLLLEGGCIILTGKAAAAVCVQGPKFRGWKPPPRLWLHIGLSFRTFLGLGSTPGCLEGLPRPPFGRTFLCGAARRGAREPPHSGRPPRGAPPEALALARRRRLLTPRAAPCPWGCPKDAAGVRASHEAAEPVPPRAPPRLAAATADAAGTVRTIAVCRGGGPLASRGSRQPLGLPEPLSLLLGGSWGYRRCRCDDGSGAAAGRPGQACRPRSRRIEEVWPAPGCNGRMTVFW